MTRRSLKAVFVAGSCIASIAHAAPPSDAEVSARAKALIAQMTPDEKAGQLSQYFYIAQFPPLAKAVDDDIAQGRASSLLFVTDPALINHAQHIAVEKTRLKIPLIFGFDVIHGLRTIMPVPLGMAASWDPAMVERAQTVAAAEARATGLHWAFAPNADIARDARWGRIVETAGEDPYLASAMSAAQVRGFQGPYIGAPGHIIAGPKHFAGYGAGMGGRDYDEVDLSESELWNVYLPSFKAAVDAGAGNIMTAYMGMNGVPGAANRWLMTKVLRETWGFKGFVVSDANAVASLTQHGLTANGADAAVRALKAGMNMEMIPPTPPRNPPEPMGNMRALPAALAAGRITQAELDRAVQSVLEAKIRMGLFENPYVDETKTEGVLNDPAHRVVARLFAERAAVLLKNENGLLPLDRKAIKSIAVIGPLADSERDILGSWVFAQNKPSGPSIVAGLRTKLGSGVRVDYSEGVRMPPRVNPSPFGMLDGAARKPQPLDETAEIARATALSRNADVTIMVLGEAQDMSGELASRASFDLPGRQQELLDAVVATGKPVVVVLMSARPLSLHDTRAGAILDVWYPGSEGAAAVGNLLFGDATPGGKLPITWVRSASQAPMVYSHLISHDPANTNKRYWEGSNAPTYVFGHGLSYTSFGYSDLKIDRPTYAPGQPVKLSVTLTNTGKRTGDEVAQLYIHQRSGTSARPVRELKGFRRVTLKPGEVRTLDFTLRAEDLRYWSDVTKDWVADQAVFDVAVGGSSAVPFNNNFTVVGN